MTEAGVVVLRCARSIAGCADCVAEEQYAFAHGHLCGPSHAQFTTLCEVVGQSRLESEEMHRLTHRAQLCEACGAVLEDRKGVIGWRAQVCPASRCNQVVCVACGVVDSSFGDVYCPSCGSLGYLVRVRRMHQGYRARRRGRW